jgi:hypothetical protein
MRRFLVIGIVVPLLGALMASVAVADPIDSVCRKAAAWKTMGFESQRACLQAESDGVLWSLLGDFRTGEARENPSRDRYGNLGVWSYMKGPTAASNDPSTYSLLGAYGGLVVLNPAGKDWTDSREGWQEPGCGADPWIGYPMVIWNKQGAVGNIRIHPADPNCPDYQNVVVGWTSPYTGQVTITGEVHDGNPNDGPSGDGIGWELRRTGTASPSELIDSGSFAPLGEDSLGIHVIDVSQGDSIYLIVSPLANNGWDGTDASLIIVGTG